MDRGPQGWAEAASSLAGNSEASSLVPGPGRQLFSGVCEPAASSGPHVVVTLSPLPSRATQNVTPQSWLWSRPCPAHLASQPRLGQVSSTQDQMCISHVGWAAGPSCLGECRGPPGAGGLLTSMGIQRPPTVGPAMAIGADVSRAVVLGLGCGLR